MSKDITRYIKYIEDYGQHKNAATASKYDANANVATMNLATLKMELYKDLDIKINRERVSKQIERDFSTELARQYHSDIEEHVIYVHDETSMFPYCASISMYPFLLEGMTTLGGDSTAPTNVDSFCGSFINLVFAIAAQFAGAIATVEFLMYLEHFVRKEHGAEWMNDETLLKPLHQRFQQVVYGLNQPAAARGYQSVFWNISVFDEEYFNTLFGETFIFPDNHEKPTWEGVKAMQEIFMTWFNKEREKALLTFPVVTVAMLTKNGKCASPEFRDWVAQEMSEGNSFFVYMSDTADSLASCCRLRNEMESNDFSYSLGAGGVKTGSLNVITLNCNRIAQMYDRGDEAGFLLTLDSIVNRVHRYQMCTRTLFDEYKAAGLLPVYDAGYIDLDSQFLTIGVNGLVEAAEFLGYTPTNNEAYRGFIDRVLSVIKKRNDFARKSYGYKFNTEFVPAENLGVKNAKWDKQDGMEVQRDCYNSYFYRVEDPSLNMLDRLLMYDKDMTKHLDGGSACHLNIEDIMSQPIWVGLLEGAAAAGVQYFTYNVKSTVCNSCGHIAKRTLGACPECGSTDVDGATRVIGYLKKVSSFSSDRQEEEGRRHYGV